MDRIRSEWRYSKLIYAVPLIFGLIFIWLNSLTSSVDGTGNQISFAMKLTILIPELVVWMIAAVGAVRFKQYANSIKDSKDGKNLTYIANALLLLVLYIIILTTAGTAVELLAGTPFLDAALILRNHLPIAVALAAVIYLYVGSKRLSGTVAINTWSRSQVMAFYVLSLLFYVIFAWNFYQAVPHLEPVNGIPRFALPVNILLFTYVLPHVVMWTLGILACINLGYFASNTKGLIYKASFSNLYKGILLIFVCIFMAQFLMISSISMNGLNFALFLVYMLLLLTILGFILVFSGTRKLNKIEDVSTH